MGSKWFTFGVMKEDSDSIWLRKWKAVTGGRRRRGEQKRGHCTVQRGTWVQLQPLTSRFILRFIRT